MRREYASIAAMAALLVGSQAVAIALSPLFQGSGYQAFPNPREVPGVVRRRHDRLCDRRRRHRNPRDFVRRHPGDPAPGGPRLLRCLGRVPHEAHDHARGRADQPAIADSPRDPEEGRLLVPGAKEPEGSDRGGGGTGSDVHRARRSHHPRNHERLRVHVLDRAGPIVPRPRAECVRRRRDGPRGPGGIFLSHAVRPPRESAGGAPPAERRRAPRLPAHEPPRVRVPEPRLGRRVIYPGSVGTTPMALWQGRSKRKPTGGRYRPFRKKRRRAIGPEQQYAVIRGQRLKLYRTKGANRKVRILSAEFANVLDRRTSATKKVKIVTVKANPSNPNFVTRNIITRGATIPTEIGLARVTSKPGQHGVINAVLLESAQS